MPSPEENAKLAEEAQTAEVRTWIAKMFEALKLGKPRFAEPKVALASDPGADPPGDPGGDPAKAEAEDGLAARRTAILLRLDALTLHDHVSVEERATISGHLTSMRAMLAKATAPDQFDRIEDALTRIEALAATANTAAAARAVRCAAVAASMSDITRPEGGVTSDYVAYDADMVLIDAIAAVPVAEDALAAAEAAVVRLKQEAARLAAGLADRAKRATAIRAGIPATLPEGANKDETDAVRRAEEQALAALGTEGAPLAGSALTEAEDRIKERQTALDAAAEGIATRATERTVVTGVLDTADLGGLTAAEGLPALTMEKEAIAAALPSAVTRDAISALLQRARKLADDADAARAARAKAMLATLGTLGDPPDLPEVEQAPLKAKIGRVQTGATAPLTATGLKDAADALAALPDLLKAAAATVADRRARVLAAATAAGLVGYPDKANADEKAALDLLRKAAALSPKPPLDEGAAAAAEEALKALNDLRAEQVLAISQREKAREAELETLLTLVPPLNAPGSILIALLKTSGALRAKIEAAATLADILALNTDVKALETEVKALTAFTKAREAAGAKLASAQANVAKASFEINQGCYQKALALAKAAGDLIDKAKTESDCTAAEAKVAEIAPLLVAARAYQPHMEQWRFDTELYVTGLPAKTPPEIAAKEAMSKLRDDLLEQADALAAAGDVDNAKAKLAEWGTTTTTYDDGTGIQDVSFSKARFDLVNAFVGKIETFVKDCVPTIQIIGRLKLEGGAEAFQDRFVEAKKKGCEEGDVTGAEGLLSVLTADVGKYAGVVPRLEKLSAMKGTKPFDDALDKANKGDPAEAGKLLDTIDATLAENAEFDARKAGLETQVSYYLPKLEGAARSAIETPWLEAPTQPDHKKKMAKLEAVASALKEARPLDRAREAAMALCTRHDPSGAFGIFAAAKAVETGGTLADAKKAYDDAAEHARRLGVYAGQAAVLEQSRKALPKDPPTAEEAVRDALANALVAAKAMKWDDADKILAAVETIPLVRAVSAAMAVYLAKRDKLARIQTRLVAQIKEPLPKAALVDPWNAAIAMAETKGDPVEATALLSVHEGVLKTAQNYAGAAREARLGLAAMDKIEVRATADARARKKKAAEQEVLKAETSAANAAEKVKITGEKLTQAKADEKKAIDDLKDADAGVLAAKSKSTTEKQAATKIKEDALAAKKEAENLSKKAETAEKNAKKQKTDADKKVGDLKAALAKKIADDGLAAATAITDAIYAPPYGKADLQKLLAAAEVEAGKGDFTKAIAAFKAVSAAAQAGMKAAAKAIEVVENGHYVSAHGPDVTDAASTVRLLTGKRPDGKMEPSNTSSSFATIEALLATREVALETLNAKFPATKETGLSKGDPLEYYVETDSEVPVGKSFKGNRMKKKYQAGEFKESRLCENFRELGPLTRVFTKVMFHFDNPNPAASKPLTNWKDVLAAYGASPPAKFPGQWVVHQHYPTATDFDPETGEYLT